jgi:hypothetical protein
MANHKIKPAFTLPVISVLLVIFGILYNRYILVLIPVEEQINNVILTAVPFICYFVAILLVYIFLINLFSQILNHRISPQLHRSLNILIIAGIIGGILMMLQPFTIILFKASFMVVLISLLLFIFWSHIIPAHVVEEDE